MRVESGQWLGGYHLIRRLGTGGAGTVWLAEDGAGLRVALKLLHPALAASEAARTRLAREATTVNAVRSSGVAHVVDVETDDVQPFVVSELIEGPTLATRLRSGALAPRELAALADALRHILDAVHAAHVVHRDVKPSNVILSATGPVLIDFGIAMGPEDEHLTGTGMVSGTAGFAAPELLRGAPASDTTDWWGWAATVLNAATGRPPYGPGEAVAVGARVLADAPDVEGLAPRVAQLLTSALRADPTARPTPALVCASLTDQGLWDGASGDPGRTSVLSTTDEGGRAHPAVGGSGGTQILAVTPTVDEGSGEDEGTRGWGRGATEVLDGASPAPTALMPTATPEPPTRWATPSSPASPQVRVVPGFTPGPQSPVQGTGAMPPAPPQWPGPQVSPADASAGVPPWFQLGYRATRPRPVPVVGVFVLAALAAIPVVLGRAGLVSALLVLVLLACLGSGRAWRERRRARHGGVRSSDTPLAVAALPLHLVSSVAGLAVGAVLGVAVSASVWLVVRVLVAGGPAPTWPLEAVGTPRGDLVAGTWVTDPLWQTVLWGLVWSALLVMWVLPTSSGARDGLAIVVHTTLAPRWSRVLACVIIAVVVGATWLITTGGPF